MQKKNKRWRENDILIKDTFYQMIVDEKKPPTLKRLAEKTGLNRNTIQKHIDSLSFQEDVKPKYKLLTDRVILSLAMSAIKRGRKAEAEYYMQLVENVTIKTEIEHSGTMSFVDLVNKASEEKEENV